MKRSAAVVLAGCFLAAVFQGTTLLAGAAAPAWEKGDLYLARRGADDAVEHREGDHHGGRGGMETSPPGTAVDAEAKALFEARCSACHPLSRPLSRNRERKWWVETVTRMQKVNGCNITDGEAQTIVDYLAKIRGPVAR